MQKQASMIARHEMVQIIADEVKKANVGYRYSESIL